MSIDPTSTHYDVGGIETLVIIQAKLTPEQYEGYLLGNIIKYTTRANWKGSKFRDIEKCATYAALLKGLNQPEPIEQTGGAQDTNAFAVYDQALADMHRREDSRIDSLTTSMVHYYQGMDKEE